MLPPHQVLRETRRLIENLDVSTTLNSDHYTNYLNLSGRLPKDKGKLLDTIDQALRWNEGQFRPIFVGTQ